MDAEHNQKGIEAYFEATNNEIAIDNLSIKTFGLSACSSHGLPRAAYLATYIKKYPNLFKIVIKLLNIFWLFPIHPILIIYQYCRLIIYKLLFYRTTLNISGDIILGTTSRADVVLRLDKNARPHQWIVVPWVFLSSIPDGESKINLMSLARWSDFGWAFIHTWKASMHCSEYGLRQENILQTYTAFKWFFVWRVLKRSCENATSIWCANHYDRWAVLIDRIPINVRKVMLQHGLLYDDFQLPVKLTQVSEFYSFDERSERAFIKNVLFNKEKIKFHKLPANIKLSEMPLESQYKKSLLIIGQPFEMEKECVIVEKILQALPLVKIYLKPHPLYTQAGYDRLLKLPIFFVKERFCFPRVNLAVTHYSTLGIEYEANGIPVIWHQDKTVDATVQSIIDYFQ